MSLTGNKLPGAAEWYGEYIGVTNLGDYNNNNGGILKFPDGTLWRWDTEATAWTQKFSFISGLQFMEYKPGNKYWQHISADWRWDQWIQFEADLATADSSGDMRDYSFGYGDFWVLSHAGDDDYVYAIDNDEDNGFIMFDKSDYSWQRYYNEFKAVDDAHPTWIYPEIINDPSCATFDADYGYYLTNAIATWPNAAMRCVRFRRGDPSDVTYFHEWATVDRDSSWLSDINPSTGRRNVFNEDYLDGYINANIAYRESNGKFYIIETGGHAAGYGHTSIREWDGHGNNTKLLYWHDDSLYPPLVAKGYSFVSSGGVDGTRDTYPEAGVGYVNPYPWPNSEARIRDGWFYWMDAGSYNNSQGMYFCRINLDQLLSDYETGGPVQHDPGNPRYEILCNASAPWEGDAKWINNVGWGVLYREGSSPIYNTLENNWFFDDDGAIVFMHEEFPPWGTGPSTNDEYTHWTMSRLIPPEANSSNISLVFEGQALKGYSNVRQQESAWAPDEVVLK